MPMRSGRLLVLIATLLLAGGSMAPAQVPGAEGGIRLAVVDMDRVMSESLLGKAEQAAIDRLRSDRTAMITQKQKELEVQEEQIRSASLSWSAEKREEHLREYETKRIELRRLNEDATRDVQAEFNRALAKLQAIALKVTGIIGSEKGYTLIFEKGSVPVLYASDSIDVTSEVVARMDAQARSGAAAAPAPGGPGGRR